MRAIITTPGAPGKLIVADRPAPQASPGFAIVRVRASSINRGETRLVPQRPDGWMPGQDVAGVIETPAPDGGPPKGARILGLADGGTWSELVAVPTERMTVIPAGVDDEIVATLPVAGLTALRAVHALGETLGRDVLVLGVRGGSGNVAAQLARIGGANVTGLARGTYALEGVRIVGELTAGERYHGVIDAIGGELLAASLSHLHPYGKAVTFAGTPGAPIGLGTFAGTPATLEALYVYRNRGRFDDDLATLVRLVASGELVPRIDRVIPFDDVNDGFAALQAGGIDGKVVLVRKS